MVYGIYIYSNGIIYRRRYIAIAMVPYIYMHVGFHSHGVPKDGWFLMDKTKLTWMIWRYLPFIF